MSRLPYIDIVLRVPLPAPLVFVPWTPVSFNRRTSIESSRHIRSEKISYSVPSHNCISVVSHYPYQSSCTTLSVRLPHVCPSPSWQTSLCSLSCIIIVRQTRKGAVSSICHCVSNSLRSVCMFPSVATYLPSRVFREPHSFSSLSVFLVARWHAQSHTSSVMCELAPSSSRAQLFQFAVTLRNLHSRPLACRPSGPYSLPFPIDRLSPLRPLPTIRIYGDRRRVPCRVLYTFMLPSRVFCGLYVARGQETCASLSVVCPRNAPRIGSRSVRRAPFNQINPVLSLSPLSLTPPVYSCLISHFVLCMGYVIEGMPVSRRGSGGVAVILREIFLLSVYSAPLCHDP